MRINTNVSALNAWKNLAVTGGLMGKSLEKLSSGYRINKAADDAAGLAISEKMRAQVSGLNQAARNAQDGISLIQTAEGALQETHSILQRVRELLIQANNDTNDSEDLKKIQEEVSQLTTEITDIAKRTEFNGKALISGSLAASANALVLQIGANSGQVLSLNINSMDSANLGSTALKVSSVDVRSFSSITFTDQLKAVDDAISQVSSERSKLGANQNRLEHTINNLQTSSENLTAAESRIRDVDMALEMASFTRHMILQQAGTAMLAQANVQTQSVLRLLG